MPEQKINGIVLAKTNFYGSVALIRGQVTYCFLMLPDHVFDPKRFQTFALSRRCYCCALVSGLHPDSARGVTPNP